jgi:hypothetical protein
MLRHRRPELHSEASSEWNALVEKTRHLSAKAVDSDSEYTEPKYKSSDDSISLMR